MSDWLNFRHLYAFWMVARAGSFTGAAKQMHVAQSAVSSQVAALEEYLGQKLLLRGHRALEVTPQGQRVLGHANSIFAQSRAINASFDDDLQLPSTLRVGVVGGASRNFVYRLLDRYVQRAATVHVSVSTGSYGELYESLRRFELDAIISLEPPKKKHLAEVTYEKLGESRMSIVGTPKLIKAIRRKRRKRLDVFKFRHPFEVDVLSKHVQPLLKQCELSLRMDTDDIPLLRFFANGGNGIAVLPKVGVLEDYEAGAVDVIELKTCPEVMIYGITMRQAHPVFGSDGVALWREPT